jgi:hypothetical protein
MLTTLSFTQIGKLRIQIWWVNFGHVNTAMHHDSNNNLLCQLAGRKRIICFPHSEWPNLYLINPYTPELILFFEEIVKSRKHQQTQKENDL